MKPVCLIIMDGWGVSETGIGDATRAAETPNLDRLLEKYPHTTLTPSGRSVGLPEGQMGNSEVGHLTLGAGRVIFQDLTRISNAIDDSSFFENPVLKETLSDLKSSGGALHLMGLVSDGGVHSHNTHLYALVRAAKAAQIEKVFIHAFLDGRDTPPKSGLGYIEELETELEEIGLGKVATVSGRYYAMDRDNRWDRVQRAYDAMTGTSKEDTASTGTEAVSNAYERGDSDEFVMPTLVADGPVSDGDSVIFFNFRADRAREITRAFTDEEFDGFERKSFSKLKSFVCMTEYDQSFGLPVLYEKEGYKNILAELLAGQGIKQFRVSETEKYAHVTFFFNGGLEEPFPGEERELIDSVRDVATYDLSPRMRADEIAASAVEHINKRGEDGAPLYGFVLMNFANGDMVGHTGNMLATIQACEAVDEGVGAVVEAALKNGYAVLVTADHGNAEEMFIPETGEPITAHSTLPVPFILVDDTRVGTKLREGCGLRDIAPTILKILSIPVPEEMDGAPLF